MRDRLPTLFVALLVGVLLWTDAREIGDQFGWGLRPGDAVVYRPAHHAAMPGTPATFVARLAGGRIRVRTARGSAIDCLPCDVRRAD